MEQCPIGLDGLTAFAEGLDVIDLCFGECHRLATL
jgi:hypothetical protein